MVFHNLLSDSNYSSIFSVHRFFNRGYEDQSSLNIFGNPQRNKGLVAWV